ncbi:hypothetical protein C8J56DRAFT_1162218 [Mycena floridula]|nr:hypothetical protein C8J56DRAFT_1162218 [Mycena floridula]
MPPPASVTLTSSHKCSLTLTPEDGEPMEDKLRKSLLWHFSRFAGILARKNTCTGESETLEYHIELAQKWDTIMDIAEGLTMEFQSENLEHRDLFEQVINMNLDELNDALDRVHSDPSPPDLETPTITTISAADSDTSDSESSSSIEEENEDQLPDEVAQLAKETGRDIIPFAVDNLQCTLYVSTVRKYTPEQRRKIKMAFNKFALRLMRGPELDIPLGWRKLQYHLELFDLWLPINDIVMPDQVAFNSTADDGEEKNSIFIEVVHSGLDTSALRQRIVNAKAQEARPASETPASFPVQQTPNAGIPQPASYSTHSYSFPPIVLPSTPAPEIAAPDAVASAAVAIAIPVPTRRSDVIAQNIEPTNDEASRTEIPASSSSESSTNSPSTPNATSKVPAVAVLKPEVPETTKTATKSAPPAAKTTSVAVTKAKVSVTGLTATDATEPVSKGPMTRSKPGQTSAKPGASKLAATTRSAPVKPVAAFKPSVVSKPPPASKPVAASKPPTASKPSPAGKPIKVEPSRNEPQSRTVKVEPQSRTAALDLSKAPGVRPAIPSLAKAQTPAWKKLSATGAPTLPKPEGRHTLHPLQPRAPRGIPGTVEHLTNGVAIEPTVETEQVIEAEPVTSMVEPVTPPPSPNAKAQTRSQTITNKDQNVKRSASPSDEDFTNKRRKLDVRQSTPESFTRLSAPPSPKKTAVEVVLSRPLKVGPPVGKRKSDELKERGLRKKARLSVKGRGHYSGSDDDSESEEYSDDELEMKQPRHRRRRPAQYVLDAEMFKDLIGSRSSGGDSDHLRQLLALQGDLVKSVTGLTQLVMEMHRESRKD